MAKEKAEKGENAELVKKYGDVFFNVDQIKSDPFKVISVSPSFDIECGGGISEGSLMVLAGPPKYGKGLSALTIAAAAQKVPSKEKDYRKVYYFDLEWRLGEREFEGIEGLDLSPEKFQVVRSSKGNILDSQKILSLAEDVLKAEFGCVLVMDSFSIMANKDELTNELGKEDRAKGNKTVSAFCRQASQIIPINRNIVIGINQVYANTGGYGGFKEKTSTALIHAENLKLMAKKREYITEGGQEDGKKIGQITDWNIEFSNLGPPGGKVKQHYTYGIGIDRVRELAMYGLDLGLIDQKGAWFTFEFVEGETKPKFQGIENLIKSLRASQELQTILKTSVYEIYGLKQ